MILRIVILLGLLLIQPVAAGDLVQVSLKSDTDARALRTSGLSPVFANGNDYLLLVEDGTSACLERAGLDLELLARDIEIGNLALDKRRDAVNTDRFATVYQAGGLRLLNLGHPARQLASQRLDILPLGRREIKIDYRSSGGAERLTTSEDITWLLDLVSQDSITENLYRLEAFYRRLTGTDSSYASRDWIEAKLQSYGYDSVYIDPFQGMQLWDYIPVQSYNVVATKVGTVFPDKQIIVGAHFDAVPDCPGADDNGSGTVCVLEIARVLAELETPMTVKFIAFDSEESWMHGSYHYCNNAVANGDDIVLMVNPDMIGEINNDSYANLYHGEQDGYARFWSQMSAQYCGITGYLQGPAPSDHLPFQEAGYDVIFVQEGFFSPRYHLPSDSTTYVNFEYMTRMIKATLALVWSTMHSPPPVALLALDEPGDGQSKRLTWESVSGSGAAGYQVCWYPWYSQAAVTCIDVPITDTVAFATGLTEGVEYHFYVKLVDSTGYASVIWNEMEGTAWVDPRQPESPLALPAYHSVNFFWAANNVEMDFDHYAVYRDGAPIGTTTDTVYNDASVGTDTTLHEYIVMAVDIDGNGSDTVGVTPMLSRAALLQPDRFLALNRSSMSPPALVDETETGAFMREAMEGYNYDYSSDSAATLTHTSEGKTQLLDLVDYGLVVVGDESGRWDCIGNPTEYYGILDTLSYYASIGGKLIVFGRWGDFNVEIPIDYTQTLSTEDDAYHDVFLIETRTPTLCELVPPNISTSQLVGAHSLAADYPRLDWDSARTVAHSSPLGICSGIPFATYVEPDLSKAEVIYGYDSRDDESGVENQPVAWRYLGEDYQFVYFDLALSFMDRSQAVAALRQAVADLTGDPESCCVIRGDVNNDGEGPDISDVVYLANYMFVGGPTPPCMAAANANGDDVDAEIADIVWIVTYMFGGGPPPVPCPE